MGVQKGIKARKSYDADVKQEITRLLASGMSVKEIQRRLELLKNGPPSRLLYRWKRIAIMKTKVARHRGKEGTE